MYGPPVRLVIWLSPLVNAMSVGLAPWAEVMHVTVVVLTTTGELQLDPPKVSVAPARKPVPRTVTAVPPVVCPMLGVMLVTVGGGFDV